MGREAVSAALKDLDGRGDATSLRKRLEERFEASSIDLLIPRVYGGEIDRVAIANLAPLVLEEARKGDDVAREIISRAGRELGKLIRAVVHELSLGEESVRVALIGSVFSQKNILVPEMMKELEFGTPDIFTEPEFDPAVGAALLALNAAGVDLDDNVMHRLHDSAKKSNPTSA